VKPDDLLPPVAQPRANQPPPAVLASPTATCAAGQEKVLVTSGAQAQNACAPACQSGERRNTAGLCIKDVPPPLPAYAENKPDPGAPPPQAPAGQLPTCPSGSTLQAAFVQGVLSNTCVSTCSCPAGQQPDASGQCAALCAAPSIWDLTLKACIDKANPPACPGGLSRGGDGQRTCSNDGLPGQDGSCAQACQDDYGSTCDADFGHAMCRGDPFVMGMCETYCGICQVGTTDVPQLGKGGAPVMPWVPPMLSQLLPGAPGEALVLDDQQLAKIFGVVSPDGSPVTATQIGFDTIGCYPRGAPPLDQSYDFRRRDDGRWQVTATGNPAETPIEPVSGFPYVVGQRLPGLVVTFTNGVGSTESSIAFVSAHQ
jgi:hypothetical protein